MLKCCAAAEAGVTQRDPLPSYIIRMNYDDDDDNDDAKICGCCWHSAADIYDDADDNYDNRQPVLILVCHLIPHCSVITMHLLVAFQGLDQKLQLNNDKFGAQVCI